ncbi:MAG: ceramidase domain-containing protein [Anaerolineales bacterium]|nr:ceramidase domain-containing protein [Anaerolineales bacterium]
MNKPSGFAFPLIAAILISALTITIFLSLNPNTWENWSPATCLQTGCFCEASNTHSPIRQAANTYSSLAFVFSGMFIIVSVRKGSRFIVGYSILMGIASIIVGVGSAFYHASLTFIGQFFDVFGMFLLAAFMLVYAFERIWKLRIITTLGLFLTLNIFLSWLQIAIPDTRRYAFAIVLIIALGFEYYFRVKDKPQINVLLLQIGIGLLTGAYFIWILDNTRTVCFERSLMQGHALWHILGAISVWFLYRYYSSETKLN